MMKTKLVERLCKEFIIPNLPGFSINGDLLYFVDMDYLLRGFSFESSAYSKDRFTIYTFIQPLFVPKNYLVFNFSKRLGMLSSGHDIWWDYDPSIESEIFSEILSSIQKYGLKFLEKGKSLEAFIKGFDQSDGLPNKHDIEAIGYTYILLGKYQESINMLNELHHALAVDILKYPAIKWMANIDNRVVSMLNLLNMEEYRKAKQKLLEWRQYTLSKLKLIGNIIEA